MAEQGPASPCNLVVKDPVARNGPWMWPPGMLEARVVLNALFFF